MQVKHILSATAVSTNVDKNNGSYCKQIVCLLAQFTLRWKLSLKYGSNSDAKKHQLP